MSMIARRVLAFPSTSMPSEPIFSTAGLLINKLKTDYQVTLSTTLFFLNKNSITQDIKKDATESDFANVSGM